MIAFLRWAGRVAFVLVTLGLLVCGVAVWKFTEWRDQAIAGLDAGSTVAQTAKGAVEFAEQGNGPAVLVFHGAPGGYDQALLIGKSLADRGYRVIAPSRPGFLRTPLATGLLFEDQADAMAALLDSLGIAEAAVIGFSTGAEPALQFALRHPERTRGLVLLSPVTKRYKPASETWGQKLLAEAALSSVGGDMESWLAVERANRDPRQVLEEMFRIDTNLDGPRRAKLADSVLENGGQLEFFRGLVDSVAPLSPRESGTRNDIVMLRGLLPAPFERITAPILAVFGNADASSAWCDPKDFSAQLPRAKVLEVGGAGQLVWFGPNAETMKTAVAGFLGGLPVTVPPPEDELPE